MWALLHILYITYKLCTAEIWHEDLYQHTYNVTTLQKFEFMRVHISHACREFKKNSHDFCIVDVDLLPISHLGKASNIKCVY